MKFGEISKGMRKISIIGDDGKQVDYSIPRGVHINVQEGERRATRTTSSTCSAKIHCKKYLVNEIQEV